MKVDIYDFDKTLVPYDSAMEFWKWSMKHYPHILILLPLQITWGALAYTKIISINTFKKHCFNFVRMINAKKAVKKFWDSHERDVYPLLKVENRKSNNPTVLISASPNFLIDEIASRIGVDYCISSHHNIKTGLLEDEFVCRREQKVVRFKELFSDAEVENVFSDNPKDDLPIFKLGKNCYLAKQGNLEKISIE